MVLYKPFAIYKSSSIIQRLHLFRSFWNTTTSMRRSHVNRWTVSRMDCIPTLSKRTEFVRIRGDMSTTADGRIIESDRPTGVNPFSLDEEEDTPSSHSPILLNANVPLAAVSYYDSYGDYQKDEKIIREYVFGKEQSTSISLKEKEPPEETLPLLPIPTLNDSLALLKNSAMALIESEEERGAFLLTMQQASSSRLLFMYQERLLERGQKAKEQNSSWLQRWWNTRCYLRVRSSNVIHSSYFFRFPYLQEKFEESERIGEPPVPSDHQRRYCKNALERATLLIYAALQYSLPILYGNGILSPVNSSKKQSKAESPTLLCSAQYKYLFGTCRIPGASSDSYRLYQYPAPHLRTQPPHVTVVCGGQFYNVLVGNVAKEEEIFLSIYQQLVAIVKEARRSVQTRNSSSFDPNVVPELGWLTSQTRGDWFQDYQYLLRNEPMHNALHTLQSSLFLLCLDDTPFDGNEDAEIDRDFALRLWNGARGIGHDACQHYHMGGNRWYDKTIQIVMTLNEAKGDNNMSFGIIGEHSMADGMPVAELSRYLNQCEAFFAKWKAAQFFEQIDSIEEASKNGNSENVSNAQPVRNIFQAGFESLSMEEKEQLFSRVKAARALHIDTTNQYDLHIFDSASLMTTNSKEDSIGLGSLFLKTMQLSPDAGIQMVIQLAAYRYFGETSVATYESTHTRRFRYGRTETIRTVSLASRNFCRGFTSILSELRAQSEENTGVRDLERSKQQEVMELFRIACDTHASYSRLAAEGLGCDRHFFGLEILANLADEKRLEEETSSQSATTSVTPGTRGKSVKKRTIPPLFRDPVYQRAKTWRLSTSTLPGTAPGFGPVVPDGFGIGYDIRSQHVIYTITAARAENDAVCFCQELERATVDVQDLLMLAYERGEHMRPRQ